MKNSIITLFVLFCSHLSGQFNTLNPPIPDNTNDHYTLEKLNNDSIENKTAKIKVKRSKRYSKKELKLQIDSLKNVLSTQSIQPVQNPLHDSILYYLKLNTRNSKPENKLKSIDIIKDNLQDFHFPINNEEFRITSKFGPRIHPITGEFKMHNGVDIAADNDNVFTVLDGYVTGSGYNSIDGNYIKIRHSDVYETIYLHLSHVYYKKGEYVKAGFIIGKSGNSGRSTGPHLHFAVKENNVFINPLLFLNKIIEVNNLIAIMYE